VIETAAAPSGVAAFFVSEAPCLSYVLLPPLKLLIDLFCFQNCDAVHNEKASHALNSLVPGHWGPVLKLT